MQQVAFRYDAFVSYSHAKDRLLAQALQGVVQTLGKPWYRRRVSRVFRDESSLSASPALWASILDALSSARFLILLACPEAAASRWVGQEVEWWRANRDPRAILIALTDGDLTWDPGTKDFRYGAGSALPESLKGAFPEEPLWIDFRGSRDPLPGGKMDRAFMATAAGLVSPIRDIPKDELVSEELRQQRRMTGFATAAAFLVALLAGGASWQWYRAYRGEVVAKEAGERSTNILKLASETAGNLLADVTNEAGRQNNSAETSSRAVQDILKRLLVLQQQLALTTGASEGDKLREAAVHGTLAENLMKTDPKSAFEEAVIAKDSFSALLINDPHNFDVQHQLVASYMVMGAIAEDRKDGRALDYFKSANTAAIAEVEDQKNKNNLTPQHDLYVTYVRIGSYETDFPSDGSILRATGAFNAALGIANKLGLVDPANISFRREQAYVNRQLAEVYSGQRRWDEAIDAYRHAIEALDWIEKLSPNDIGANYGRATALSSIGSLQAREGKTASALESYNSALEICKSAASRDSANTTWPTQMNAIYVALGDLEDNQNDLSSAETYYAQSLDVIQRVADADPKNDKLQRNLSLSYSRIGNIQMERNDFEHALQSCMSALDISKHRYVSNSTPASQRDLVVDYEKVGDVELARNDAASALLSYREALNLSEAQAQFLRSDENAQLGWEIALAKIAQADLKLGSNAEALAALNSGHEILAKLVADHPRNEVAKQHLTWFDGHIAALQK